MTDRFQNGKTINQYKQIRSSISPASSTSSLNERDYKDIEQYDSESTNDETEIAELNFENQEPDSCRDHFVAHESFRTETEGKPILKKPNSIELLTDVTVLDDLIQILGVNSREADLDIQTLLEEQLSYPVPEYVRKWIKTSDT